MSAAFLRDVTANVAAAGRGAAIDGWIAYAPRGAEAAFDGVIAPGTRLVVADGRAPMPAEVEGFGRCLLHAARALYAKGYGSVCLLNSDSPNLPTRFSATPLERSRHQERTSFSARPRMAATTCSG